ncbi:MAG: acyltransferase [Anaerolineae bacterium]|jgi:peptidoglycan/LPS O-acetylase OafA/YrhL
MKNSDIDGGVSARPLSKKVRLHYLDWLRVLLILAVFLYHAASPFRPAALPEWHIRNAEGSEAVMAIMLLANPWVLPLFFLVAGAASRFALRRRSNRQYIWERVSRLLIPLIVGSILLTPIQAYLEALNEGTFQGSFLSYIPAMLARKASNTLFSPSAFGIWGYHLWFLGFLFGHSLLALPLFRWFKRDAGQSFISWLGRLVEKRGGILVFVIPLAVARVVVQPFVPIEEHGWLDFVYFFLFFVYGYIIYSDDRFLSAVRRDRWLLFAGGVVGLVAYFAITMAYGDVVIEWFQAFVMPWTIILILTFALMSWGWALDVLYLVMKHLKRSNRWLVYGNDTLMPFYVLHQPVIIVIAYFVVQWNAGVGVKLLVIVFSSFLATLGLVELLVRPFEPMRRVFGMKSRRPKKVTGE